MNNIYLDLMAKTLSAYTDEHIIHYFGEVKKNGLTEHGFPRLTSNIGILIANGKRQELLPLFCEMMEFCCKSIPTVKAANDFSVREIICCIGELEKSGNVSAELIMRWKSYLKEIDPEKCYNVYAKAPTDPVRNWALYTAVSEYFRQQTGLCNSSKFIDIQIASQLQWLDENGMYMDNSESAVHQPITYDIVPRVLFSLLLYAGYRGSYYKKIDDCLKKSGLFTLNMQSASGELAFGGRSNQFLHNEALLAAILEYEAARYNKTGDFALAGKFKAAAGHALASVEHWLSKTPVSHIKNRFSVGSNYGCEDYAYFDKYMITVASFLYIASLFCDNSAVPSKLDESPEIWCSSKHFHKIFARAGGYSLEFDTDSDPHYDASGLGRIHKKNAPSAICLSVPCPAQPKYFVDLQEPEALSLCPGIRQNGIWRFATDYGCVYDTASLSKNNSSATIELCCKFSNNETVFTSYKVDKNGVFIEISRKGELAHMLPAFYFDGQAYTDITFDKKHLSVIYDGWECRYTTNGKLTYSGKLAANRNGHYKVFWAAARDSLWVKIKIARV